MMTIDTTIVAPVTDAEATPLSPAEADALLAQSAGAERKPTVPGEADSRAWASRGQVD